jgi:hypothetical protein
VVGFTTGSRGKVQGKTCEKRIRNNNNNNLTEEHTAGNSYVPIAPSRR